MEHKNDFKMIKQSIPEQSKSTAFISKKNKNHTFFPKHIT